MIEQLEVKLYGETLGYLGRNPQTGLFSLEYDPEFRRACPFEPAPLKMAVSPRVFSFPELIKTSFQGLPGMIADARDINV